jgi:hypothetical protein
VLPAAQIARLPESLSLFIGEPWSIGRGFSLVRPAWAHSYGCKSRHKLVTVSEAKRNCMRVTECGEEAWSEAACR